MASRRSSIVPYRPSRDRSHRSRARHFRSQRRKNFPLAAPLLILVIAFFAWAAFAPQAPAIAGALWSSVSQLVTTGEWLPPTMPQSVASTDNNSRLTGSARVIDADTIEIGDTRIRLYAVDAPEGAQRCYVGGSPKRCGASASDALEDWIAGRTVACIGFDTDPYGRTVATCRVGGEDVGRWLVQNGYAVAYRDFGEDYVCDEAEAERAGRGIWASVFIAPSQWRRLPEGQQDDPPGVRYNPGWPDACG